MVTQVDPLDFDKFNKFKWCASFQGRGERKVYAVRFITISKGVRKKLWLHREIMNTPSHLVCDHDDRDGLNNCRYNLKNITQEKNMEKSGFYNRRKRQ